MNDTLDPKDQNDLERLAQVEGKDPGALLRELVHQALVERRQNGAPSSSVEEAIVAKQRKAFEELIEELDGIPSEGLPAPEGRLVSENVDEYLYGWKE